jgi:hypothetical protein
MMKNKREGLVAVVGRWAAELLRRLGGSGSTLARPSSGAALAVNAEPVPTDDEGGCPDPAHCPAPGMTGVAAAT